MTATPYNEFGQPKIIEEVGQVVATPHGDLRRFIADFYHEDVKEALIDAGGPWLYSDVTDTFERALHGIRTRPLTENDKRYQNIEELAKLLEVRGEAQRPLAQELGLKKGHQPGSLAVKLSVVVIGDISDTLQKKGYKRRGILPISLEIPASSLAPSEDLQAAREKLAQFVIGEDWEERLGKNLDWPRSSVSRSAFTSSLRYSFHIKN